MEIDNDNVLTAFQPMWHTSKGWVKGAHDMYLSYVIFHIPEECVSMDLYVVVISLVSGTVSENVTDNMDETVLTPIVST